MFGSGREKHTKRHRWATMENTSQYDKYVSTYIRQKLPDVYPSLKRKRELQDALSATMTVISCARECHV